MHTAWQNFELPPSLAAAGRPPDLSFCSKHGDLSNLQIFERTCIKDGSESDVTNRTRDGRVNARVRSCYCCRVAGTGWQGETQPTQNVATTAEL